MILKRNFIVVISLIAIVGIIISEFIDRLIYPFLSLPWFVCILSLYLIIIGIYVLLSPKRVREQINQSSDSTIKCMGVFIIIVGILFFLLLYIRWLLFQIQRMAR